MRPELKQSIDSLVSHHPVVLFMKGTRERPQCGFSKHVVAMLNELLGDYITVDILADSELREAIKVYSQWPTIPQLYINGEFIGGCDITLEMFKSGELQNLLNIPKAVEAPLIKITDSALAALKQAQEDNDEGEAIRISVAANFEHGLSFDQKTDSDFVISYHEVDIVIDPYSALRAHDLTIDYVANGLEAGFVFNNPNEPPAVNELSVEGLKAWIDQGKDPMVIDVCPQAEWDQARISFAKPLDGFTADELSALKNDQPLVFHCHHGGRSKRVAESFRLKGFTNLHNLA